MWKKLVLFAVLAVVGFFGYAGYDYYRADLHNAPDIGESGFLLSYKAGFKAAMKDIPDDRAGRRYLGYANPETPSVYEDSWSICRTPTELEAGSFAGRPEKLPGERLEGICEIDADGDVFTRGWVSSIPDV